MANREAGATKLLGLVTRNLQHAENHMLLLGRKTAVEKVAAFLSKWTSDWLIRSYCFCRWAVATSPTIWD
jgi:hypothetical protein